MEYWKEVTDLVRQRLSCGTAEITRCETGLCHYVYRVRTDDGRILAARLSPPKVLRYHRGSLYWYERLRDLIPLPRFLAWGEESPCAYVLMEWIDGVDLGGVYDTLTREERRTLAHRLADIQRRVETLPTGKLFGYLSAYDDPKGLPEWGQVVRQSLARSESRILQNGVYDASVIEPVLKKATDYQHYFASVPPTPFLDDITTKNVLIRGGALAGIVDVDHLCFGDRLYTLGLTKMALLSVGFSTDYIGDWLEAYGAGERENEIVNFYTLIFCLDFMGEAGMRFNRDQPVSVDEENKARMLGIYRKLLDQL